jgi:hypothetical protein
VTVAEQELTDKLAVNPSDARSCVNGHEGSRIPVVNSHELFRELLRETNAKTLADVLGLSTSLIYKWAESPESGSGVQNPLDRVAQLAKLPGGENVVQWVCGHAGGFFVRDPNVTLTDGARSLFAATHQIVQEFAEMLSAIATAAADDKVCEKETKGIRARWQTLKSATEEFVRCCEEQNFAGIVNKAREVEERGRVAE